MKSRKPLALMIISSVLTALLAGCSPPVGVPVAVYPSDAEVIRRADGLTATMVAATHTAVAVVTQQAQATLNIVATEDTVRREVTAIVMVAQANATAQSLALQPTLTLAAATGTAGWATQSAQQTATTYPLIATPAAAELAVTLAQSESALQSESRWNNFWNALQVMCIGILLAATIVAVALIAKSNGIIPELAADVRLFLTLAVEHRRQQNALALVQPVNGSKEFYTLPGPNGIEVHSLTEGNGPVVIDVDALDREWRLAVWRLCEAAEAAGTFAGDVLEEKKIIANDDDNWKLLTDVMDKAGILEKRERARTKYAPSWSLARINADRDSLRLPHPNRLPPAVSFLLERQIPAD